MTYDKCWIHEFVMPDSSGTLTPEEMRKAMEDARDAFPTEEALKRVSETLALLEVHES